MDHKEDAHEPTMNSDSILKKIHTAFEEDWTELDLANCQLSSLPPEIGQLSELHVLYLPRNQLRSLPATIGNLTNLRGLDLHDNVLQELPAEIGQLTNLKELHLDGNQLRSLPPEIGRLANLEELHLGRNILTTLPREIGQLTSLQDLHIQGNRLTSLPWEIGQLKNLQLLAAYGNPLRFPPYDVVRQGKAAILAYLRQQQPVFQRIGSPSTIEEAAREIAEHCFGRSVLFLVGAGVSMDAPANLPSAQEFVDTIIGRMIRSAPVQDAISSSRLDGDELEKLLCQPGRIKLEFLFYTLQRTAGRDVNVLLTLLDAAEPNINHINIVNLANHFGLHGRCGIVTTNFDTLLEKASHETLRHAAIGRTSEDEFLDAYWSSIAPIFKFHGSVDRVGLDGGPDISITQLARSQYNFRGKYLTSLISDIPNVIVLGYGGADFWDVYPLLFRGVKGTLIWVDHSSEGFSYVSTESAATLPRPRDHITRLVAEGSDRHLLRCHTAQLLSSICCCLDIEPNVKPSVNRDLRYLKNRVDEWIDNRDWKIGLDFAGILRSAGEKHKSHLVLSYTWERFGERLDTKSRMEVLKYLGEHYNDRFTKRRVLDDDYGRYVDAQEKYFESAIRIAREIQDEESRFAAELKYAIFLSEVGYGDFARPIYDRLSGEIPEMEDRFLLAEYIADLGLNIISTARGEENRLAKGSKLLRQAIAMQWETGDMNRLIESANSLANFCGLKPWGAQPGQEGWNPEEAINYYLLAGALAYAKRIRPGKVDQIVIDTLAHIRAMELAATMYVSNEEEMREAVRRRVNAILDEHEFAYCLGFSELIRLKLSQLT